MPWPVAQLPKRENGTNIEKNQAAGSCESHPPGSARSSTHAGGFIQFGFGTTWPNRQRTRAAGSRFFAFTSHKSSSVMHSLTPVLIWPSCADYAEFIWSSNGQRACTTSCVDNPYERPTTW